MKNFINHLRIYAFWIALFAGLGTAGAQTTRDLLLTGGPDLGTYPGFEMDGTFDLNFMNVSGVNPTTTTPLIAGSLRIVLALPPGFEFADTYTPPAGWTYLKSGTTSAMLTQTGAVSSSPPASLVSFSVPFRTKAAVTEGVWSAQIQRILPTYQDSNPSNNTPNGVVSVIDKALPVELIAFKATAARGEVLLAWQTAKEVNSAYFDIVRSLDGRSWTRIGSVTAAGESSETRNYNFTDEHPADDVNYYRLYMVDKDRTAKYSPVRSVVMENPVELALYPNPASRSVTLKVSKPEEIAAVTLFSTGGNIVYTSERNVGERISVDTLPVGLYVVQVRWNNGMTKSSRLQIDR